jgi:inositol transporter-like SP family MFS transporter
MTSSEALGTRSVEDGGTISRQQWRWSVLAGTASYLDAGSIVALGAGLGVWSFFLPTLAGGGFTLAGGLLTLFLVISGATGFFFTPDTSGKSLEQIEAERATA